MAACNPSTLIASAKCFSCLSKKELQAVIAQLLCNIAATGGGGGGVGAVMTGAFADPNGNVTPADTTAAALYYQDDNALQFWRWSVTQQLWLDTITT